MHQNRASPFASDFYCRRGYRRELRSEDRFYPFSSQKESRFASDFLRRGNRASWGRKKSRDLLGSGENRRRNRRESRDFGALSKFKNSPQKKGWGLVGGSLEISLENVKILNCFNLWALINSVQTLTRCIVKGEAQKSHFSGDFLRGFDFLRIACSLGIPLLKFNGCNLDCWA